MLTNLVRYDGKKLSPLHEKWKQRIEQVLSERLPSADTTPRRLHEAMRYSTLNGGKRIRAMLVYATGSLFSADDALLDTPACAIEAIQCFSLIHDDLPALDDDDLRRGKPSCHSAFDEATAILAGDALQMFAFEQLSNGPQNADQKLTMIRILSEASGSAGMIGGGSLELEVSKKKPNRSRSTRRYTLAKMWCFDSRQHFVRCLWSHNP